MRWLIFIFILISLLSFSRCMIFEMEEEEEIPHDSIGVLEVEFLLPEYDVPADKIHLIDLSISFDRDSAIQGKFIRKANVSDSKMIYQFTLLEREYYFRAAISCSCGGDTCSQEGFPGGQNSIKYSFQPVTVDGGKIRRYLTSFN